MTDVEKLVSMVCEVLESEEADKAFTLQVLKEKGLSAAESIWIPSLDGSTAYRLGELSERRNEGWRRLSDVCDMLDVDLSCLVAAVKSMQRWERHNGRWDREVVLTCWMNDSDKKRLLRFVKAAHT